MADKENLLTPEELEALSSGIEDGSIESNTGLNGDVHGECTAKEKKQEK